MSKIGASPGKVTLYGLVRDANGKPLIDDVLTVHPEIVKLLTDSERADLEAQQLAAKRTRRKLPYIWS